MWKDVQGYEGIYQVDTSGNVRSVDRTITYDSGVTRRYYGSMRRCYIDTNGYAVVNLSKDGKAKKHLVHRLVAIAFIPKVGGKYEVNHKNCNKSDNRVENLEWVTMMENIRHYNIFKNKK